ncbi:MAG TPA: DUF2281 domain-containing protein [Candidatus Brocadiia bacterium]|nr:DUF2281 domain-containing protein [Planctomycetota bacterium]MDO8093387.1 hypothetical protein [Candidatus Brocadiales bacterium]
MHAYKYITKILENGKIELPKLPLKKGVEVEVIILPQSEDDLLKASESSLNFWYNDIDDGVWNSV